MALNLRRSPSPKRRRREDESPTRGIHQHSSTPIRASREYGIGPSSSVSTQHPYHHQDNTSAAGPSSSTSRFRHHSYGADSTTIHSAFYDVVIQTPDSPSSPKTTSARPEDILPRLGPVLLDQSGTLEGDDYSTQDGMPRSGSGSSIVMIAQGGNQNKTPPSASTIAQADLKFERKFNELLNLEKSYVRRIDALYHDYAIPLRQRARDKETAIVPLYESHKLFGNISEILSCNQAFLYELEMIFRDGIEAAREHLGATLYKHMIMFSCYKEYISNFDKNMISSLMKGRTLRDFVDRTRQASIGIGNSGLTELLMEPVQRIPRYKLLFAELSSLMLRPTDEHQLILIRKAMGTIDEIAMCEADEKTKQAAVLWSFSRNVDSFPPALISAKRDFVDCIDVDDFPLDGAAASAATSYAGLFSPSSTSAPFSPQTPGGGGGAANSSSSGRPIPCTLFLFDDRLVIAKRASASTCGRKAVGLEDLTKLANTMKWNPDGGLNAENNSSSKRGVELGFRGSVDLMDVCAMDLGGPDFQVVMGRAPAHVSGEKWTGRLVRNFSTLDYVHSAGTGIFGSGAPPPPPPSSLATHGTTASTVSGYSGSGSGAGALRPGREEKARFLENLFRAQALFKARDQKSEVRVLAVAGSESRGETGRKLIFWNVYSRRAYLGQQHKAPVVVHVDLTGRADPIPFGPEHHPPHARLRIHALDLPHGQCYTTASIKGVVDDDDDQDPHPLSLTELSSRLQEVSEEARNVNDFNPTRLPTAGSTRTESIFSTPSHRGRTVVQGLENFRRSLLFGGGGGGGGAGSSGTPSHVRAGSAPSVTMGGIPDPLGSPSKRTKSSTSRTTTTDTISSVFSHATSNLRSSTAMTSTTGTGATSVNSRDMMMMMMLDTSGGGAGSGSPTKSSALAAGLMSPRKLHKKKRSSSVGAPDGEAHQAHVQAQAQQVQLPVGVSSRYGSHFTARLKDGDEPGSENGTPQNNRISTRHRVQSTPMQDLLDLRAAAAADSETISSLKAQVAELERERAVLKPLQTQVRMLSRKVEVLTVLEKDGQLENTELHKAFNEELDGLYEHTQKPEHEELTILRLDAKKTKAERNEYSAMVRALKRELELERGEKAVFKAILEENGLL
ncbi:hypothetical protein A4X09_0g2490 [Tilletia walkeri]|uniref:DH domain-containing protein n=1 Tax=Tilletia walkeri TaxID=117179 RepID=A0A8X7T5S7_9BASI|nr:hypothetical protein A4X09_0g2490 [Tilletia walkeri]